MRVSVVPIFLAAALAGCGYGRPALVVEMNGRKVEFERYQAARTPRGIEVTHMDPGNISVQGNSPIEVNGLSVLARDDELTIGNRKISLDSDAKVVVRKGGEIEIQLSPTPAVAPAVTPAAK